MNLALRKFLLALPLLSAFFAAFVGLGSCDITNSFTSDKALIGVDASSPFGKAAKVLQQNCLECHTTWADYKSEADFMNDPDPSHAGMIVAGNPATSCFYMVTINRGSEVPGCSFNKMPTNSSVVSDADAETIKTWIQSMTSLQSDDSKEDQ